MKNPLAEATPWTVVLHLPLREGDLSEQIYVAQVLVPINLDQRYEAAREALRLARAEVRPRSEVAGSKMLLIFKGYCDLRFLGFQAGFE